MNIGKRIKERRKELGLSVDDVAGKLGKNRATVYRYESSDIENLPITILEPLSRVLKTTPDYLMGWYNKKEVIEEPKQTISKMEKVLLDSYNKLNDIGKKEAIKRVAELAEIPKYCKDSYLEPIAAHGEMNKNNVIDQRDLDDMDNW